MRLVHIHEIKATIRLRSGLHIGAGKDGVEIGGLDQPIIKDPLSGAPYIPGSSLKGKMRSLLETTIFMGKSDETKKAIMAGKPCNCGHRACPVCVLFGSHKPAKDCDDDLGPTRLLIRDSYLSEDYAEKFCKGALPMEVKMENTIHRVTGTAENPRPLERVPANVCFDMQISIKVYEDDDKTLPQWIFKGLKLIEMDALGGNSSRGSGQVVFEDLTMDNEKIDLQTIDAF